MSIKINGSWDSQGAYIHKGPTVDFLVSPEAIVSQRKLESVLCFYAGNSIHDVYPESEAELGTPLYREDLIIFKNNETGRELYKHWSELGSINLALLTAKVTPCVVSNMVITDRVDPSEQPRIIWGE